MRGAAIFAALLMTSAAQAQDLLYSDAATEQCIEASEGMAAADCAGRSANLCMTATSDGGTTIGMGGCLNRELAYWDSLLNRNYAQARDRAKSVDDEMRELGSVVTGLEAALRDMQRAWIPFRDATCSYERTQWGGGSGGGPATLACLMRMTAQQAVYLEYSWLGE